MRWRLYVAMVGSVGSLVATLQACGGGTTSLGPSDSGSGTTDAAGQDSQPGSEQEAAAPEGSLADVADAAQDSSVTLADAGAFVMAAHPAFPQVPSAGKTMSAPTLVTIVAANDSTVDGTDTSANMQAFSDAVPGSAVWAAVSSEYNLGTLSSVAHLTGPAIPVPGEYTTSDLQNYVAAVIGSADGGGVGPMPNGNTIYLVYLPAGAGFSGRTDCGYHMPFPSDTASAGDQVAAVDRCTPAYQETQLGSLTLIASHEIVESATDPLGDGYHLPVVASQPWTQSVWQSWDEGAKAVELGDLCEGTRTFETALGGPSGGWEYQRMWSNAAAATGGDPCVPAAAAPYYSVSSAQGWYSVQAGGTVEIPLTGWSTAAAPNWLVKPFLAATNDTTAFGGIEDAGLDVTSEAGVGTVAGCFTRFAVNNAQGAVVEVTAPASATSGDYMILRMDTFRETASCYPAIAGDDYHFWPVGVYVP